MDSPKPGHAIRLSEDETLERIRRTLGNGIEAPDLRDDAAVVDLGDGGPLIVSVDSVVEGVHVDLAVCSAPDVGWKALMGALSDLAAMGARPSGALVALCVPESGGAGETTLGVMEGVAEAARASACPVVGGDVSSSPVLVVSVTVLGTVPPGEPGPVRRSDAVAGDAIFVTGPCGGSSAGLRALRSGTGDGIAYRRPVALLPQGQLARRCGAHAMVDVSDGLALDLHRLADASGVGFALEGVPVAQGATEDDALGGGEDYELVITMAQEEAEAFLRRTKAAGLPEPVQLGVVTNDPEQRTLRGRELARLGWQHRVG